MPPLTGGGIYYFYLGSLFILCSSAAVITQHGTTGPSRPQPNVCVWSVACDTYNPQVGRPCCPAATPLNRSTNLASDVSFKTNILHLRDFSVTIRTNFNSPKMCYVLQFVLSILQQSHPANDRHHCCTL